MNAFWAESVSRIGMATCGYLSAIAAIGIDIACCVNCDGGRDDNSRIDSQTAVALSSELDLPILADRYDRRR